MAFRPVTETFAADRAVDASKHARSLSKRHAEGVTDLLKAAGTENPTDANTHLAAIKTWRAGADERALYWRHAALLQIGSGDRPDDVCSDMGFGRTALQQAIRTEGSKLSVFTELLYTARPKRKEAS